MKELVGDGSPHKLLAYCAACDRTFDFDRSLGCFLWTLIIGGTAMIAAVVYFVFLHPAPTADARAGQGIAARAPAFASVEEARAAAVQKYPELAVPGSEFHRQFLATVETYRRERPAVLERNDWPLRIADEVAALTR